MKTLMTLVFVCAVACSAPSVVDSPESTPTADVDLSVDAEAAEAAEAALNSALDTLWELNMSTHPTRATYEGDRRFDDRLTDISPMAREAHLVEIEAIAATVADIDPELLSATSRDTRELVMLNARQRRAKQVCHSDWWSVDGLGGPQVDFPMLPVFQTIRNETDLENLRLRYLAIGPYVEQHVANIRTGVAAGYATTLPNAERALAQLDELLARPIDEDPMLEIVASDGETAYDTSGLRGALETVVRPAFGVYREVVRDEVLPAARTEVGISALPDGAACYRVLVEGHLGPGFDPDQLHQWGIEQLEWAHNGMLETADAMGVAVETAQEFIAYMRSNESQFTDSAEELMTLNRAAVARMQDALPTVFGRLPETPIEVWEMEAHRAADAPAAYYYNAPADGSRPAVYYVNAYLPETRPLYNLEALAFHEAVPGHHLQSAIAQELPELHIWRRNQWQTAFGEGWALYSEVLADDMGVYSSPAARFGMYNYQAWRAVRLVVDTGIHDMGWSRQRALDFMLENTALLENEAANEIDRYIAWPGQALAYMVGRLEIERLRDEARQALGDDFSLAEFHDQVLGNGSVPLTILRANIEAWLSSQSPN